MESPVILGGLVFLVLILLLLTSLWIAVAIAMVGALGFLILRGDASLIAFVPYNTADSFILTAIPPLAGSKRSWSRMRVPTHFAAKSSSGLDPTKRRRI